MKNKQKKEEKIEINRESRNAKTKTFQSAKKITLNFPFLVFVLFSIYGRGERVVVAKGEDEGREANFAEK